MNLTLANVYHVLPILIFLVWLVITISYGSYLSSQSKKATDRTITLVLVIPLLVIFCSILIFDNLEKKELRSQLNGQEVIKVTNSTMYIVDKNNNQVSLDLDRVPLYEYYNNGIIKIDNNKMIIGTKSD